MKAKRTGVLLAFVGLCIALAGCASSSRQSHAKLSEAANEAKKDDPEEKATLEVESDDDEDSSLFGLLLGSLFDGDEETEANDVLSSSSVEASTSSDVSIQATGVEPKQRRSRRDVASIGWLNAYIAGSQLGTFNGLSLSGGGYVAPQVRAGGEFYVGRFSSGTAKLLDGAIEDISELGFGGSIRYYVTPDHTALGLYGTAGARYGWMGFTFRTPVTVEEDGEERTIDADWLAVFSPRVGVGLSLVQTRHVHIGASVSEGIRLYAGTTHQGFDNDVFPTVGFTQLWVEGSAIW